MAMQNRKRRWLSGWAFCNFALIFTHLKGISAQIRYSIQEELKVGTAVGNIANDLGFDTSRLADRNLRIVSGTKQDLFQVNQRDGALLVHHRVDREELCVKSAPCFINLKAVIENPLEMHQVTVEIMDVNDNSPTFPDETYNLEILESATTGARLQLEGAHDPDTGVYSLQSYKLSQNQYFRVEIEDFGEDGKIPFLILKSPLDREHIARYDLTLTALDGGKPPKSGTLNVTVTVSDVNDNTPVCDKQKYTVTVKENVPKGTFLLRVNASDSDEGVNGEVEYSLRSKFRGMAAEPFELDSKTGELKVKGGLDFEEKQVYEMKILASDKGAVSLSTHCNVLVRVEDVNDNRPEIDVTSLSSRIPEDATPGTVVALMGMNDLDSEIVYSLDRGNTGQRVTSFLNINEGNGTIYALKSFDFETLKTFQFCIIAKDSGTPSLSSNVTVNVFILDQNDNAPVILYPVSPNGSAEVTDHSLFALDRYTGQIRTLRSFTETDEAEHKLVILVKDNGNVSLSATATVIIKVVEPKEAFAASDVKSSVKDDEEENSVTFYLIITLGSVSTLFLISIIVLIVMQCSKTTDYSSKYLQDVNYDGTLTLVERRFRIVSASKDALFQVNQNNGVLYVHKIIDREELCDGNSACLIDLKMVVENPLEIHYVGVEITDVNDNSPSFPEIAKGLDISESTHAGSHFQLPAARDLDSGINSIRLYKLSQNANFELEVRDRGDEKVPFLVLQKTLDREQKCEHRLLLTAIDGGNPPRSTNLNLTITDVNDNKPDIEVTSLSNLVREDAKPGTVVYLISVTDNDSGINGKVVCSLSDTLYLVENNAPGASIFSVSATDKDLNENSVISYHIAFAASDVKSSVKDDEENSVTFYLIVTLGSVSTLFLISIIVEKQSEHRLVLTAVDGGSPQRSGTLNVTITVLDSNDNNPVFSHEVYSVTLPENVQPGTIVLNLKATDLDDGSNGDVEYLFGSELLPKIYDVFSLDKATVTRQRLDRELVSHYDITITATDCGQPPLSTFKTLSVQISDVNDNSPEFSQNPLELYLVENNAPGASIFSVSACDKDLNENAAISYHIHKLVILVKDNGNVSLSATATVIIKVVEPKEAFAASDVKSSVKDEEENSVTFYLIITLGSVSTLFLISIIVLIVMQCSKTTDYSSKYLQDHPVQIRRQSVHVSSTQNEYRFYYCPGNQWEYSSGSLRSKESFWRGKSYLKIVVENPLEVHYVGLEITDVNDHSPSFSEKNLHIEIAENKPAGARFELQPARDFDSGINSIRSYKLNPNEHFDLELRDSGEGDTIPFLILQKALDREQETKHSLLLTALDGGNPPGTGTLNITVTVLDANDNQPVCSQDVYSVTLQENANIGRFVVRVNATDADHGSNGVVEYTLGRNLKRRVHDIFLLDRITGAIKDNVYSIVTKGRLDREFVSHYDITITAIDCGQPPLSTFKTLSVQISDVNDNSPKFSQNPLELYLVENNAPDTYSARLRENAALGTVVVRVNATDLDEGSNGELEYTLGRNLKRKVYDIFELDSLTGEIKVKDNMYSLVTKHRLDRELVSVYDITITATDCGQPPLSTFKTLSVQISDVNDNSPEFSQNPLELYLVENNAPGASIFSVSATDEDLNENAAISYHIVRGEGTLNDMASFLNINSDNGHISALKSFNFETLKTFQFQVVATDSGTPPLSRNVTINVFILDQNDNAPVILYPIRTLRSFTETDEAEHKLDILVKDNGNVSLSATATVIIKVVEPKEAFAASDVKSSVKDEEENSVTFYLIITLGSVSTLFLISIIVLIAMQCSKPTDYSSKYLQDVNNDGTLCHSIQYRSGDKRYMLVGPRMSIGSTIVPGSNGNTLVLPEHRRRASGEVRAVSKNFNI
ncbi:unnamed protein product [Oncorhynchus mykiss]|uniref:Cadherin domain-containing protein n=1 Tax=Oncorhynchus mykiss TaxID=8022 RepID=A0A060XGJ7_ONCMY|nr:unnamed protein product [Oncorhynchus mykiss]